MPMTKEEAQAYKQHLITKRYGGDEAAYRRDMAERGRKGGKKGTTGGFAFGELGRRRASVAGRKGGRISRPKSKNA